MDAKAETKESRFDPLKWPLVTVLVVVAVVGDQYFSARPVLYRVLGILVLAVITVFLALRAAKGQAFFGLAKEARVEIRKIMQPNCQETTQTTLVMVAIILVVALLLWGLDSLLGWLVSMIVG